MDAAVQNLQKGESHMKDGWHVVAGCDVYVEGGYIVRATKNNGRQSASVYRHYSRPGTWYKEYKITPAAFRAGVKRGTIAVM